MSGEAKSIYEVQIAGLPLKLRSSHDSQTVSDLINLVDQKVTQAMEVNKAASYQSALVLAALNIAEELVLLKKTAKIEIDRVEERAQIILDQLEEMTATSS